MNEQCLPWWSTVQAANNGLATPCACAHVEPAETTYAIELACDGRVAI
jgi:hypothetical protein